MFFTYLWQASGYNHQDAYGKFSSVLLKQCKLYEKALGLEPALKIKQIENILIGQILYDPGVIGWEPWHDRDGVGIVWGGVCEDYLGQKLDTAEIVDIMRVLDNDPEKLLDWNGMFSIVTWHENEKRVTLATAATECPTLWHTEGPFGWAAGTRATPLLEMVGNRSAPDMGALGLYLAFGYFIGGHSPFKCVNRIRDRQLITLKQNEKPAFRRYVSLSNYLGSVQKSADWKGSVSRCANRLLNRVGAQITHSTDPVVLLSGGRDSRTIATAAKKSGHNFITATGGPADSEDVIIAAQVAKILNVANRYLGNGASPALICNSVEQLKLWTQMSEGIIPLNYCLYLKDYLTAHFPVPAERSQFFHGLETGIGRGSYYPNYPDITYDQIAAMTLQDAHAFTTKEYKRSYLRLNKETDDLLQGIYTDIDSLLNETDGKIYHWFELLLWRERGLIWGMDLQSVYSPIRWPWMPLFDREIIKLSWDLTFDQKISARFLLDVTAGMEPALSNVNCTQYAGMKRVRLSERIKHRILAEVRNLFKKTGAFNFQGSQNAADLTLAGFWETVLFSNMERFWKEFIEENELRRIIRISPQNDMLWRLSTIEFMTEFFK
jgi:hypothetical protein